MCIKLQVLIVFHIYIQDCPTRLGSMNKMISRILEQEEAIRRTLSSDRKTISLNLTWQDKDILESTDKVFSQLSSLTDILSGENFLDSRFKSKYIGDSTFEEVKLQVISEAIPAVSDCTAATTTT